MKLPAAAAAFFSLATAAFPAASVVSDTAAFGFTDLLSYRNATSKGWNFGNSAANAQLVSLLGVTFRGNLGTSDAGNGLTFTTAPSTYAISGFAWTGAPDQAARDLLSRGGLHGGTGNFAMRFTTTPGKIYIVEILALDASAPAGRSMDVIIDNVTVINDWFIPVGAPYNRLARIQVAADDNGIDLRMGRGGLSGTDQNPAISAVAITEELASPPGFVSPPCSQSHPAGGTATFSVVPSGNPPPTLQWRFKGTPIEGQTSRTLTIPNLEASHAGSYDVVATNENGSATSAPAILSLVPLVSPSPFSTGLLGYWRFDETTGCTAADASGQHHSGNLINYPTGSDSHWTTGRIGGALRFGGPSSFQHVIVTDVPRPPTAAYSLAAWVMADARPTWATIAKNWFGFMHFGLDANGGQLSNYFGLNPSGQIRIAEAEPFPLNSWQHVVCTAENGTLRLYRNGSLAATQTFSGSSFPSPPSLLGIGAKLTGSAADPGTPGYWQGLIDEMALWHRTLTTAEVATLYAAGVQGLSLDNPNPEPPARSLVISEFLARNNGSALDEDYDSPDWIELFNGSPSPVDLNGHFLSDDPANLRKWRFPAITLAPGQYLVVWASGKDRRNPAKPLHTNFQLSSSGEDLALTAPDGTTILHAYTSPLSAPQGDWFPPEPNVSLGLQGGPDKIVYFPVPTPGTVNAAPLPAAGPLIDLVQSTDAAPTAGSPVTITARIRPQNAGAQPDAVASATLAWRVNFGPESSATLRDDGTEGDAAAGDGIFTARFSPPATAGQLLRWRLTATATSGASRKSPQNLLPDSPIYHGLVFADPTIATPLPVLHRFIAQPNLADTEAGTTCSIFFNGQFHDNCRIRIRGNTSRGFPKKSHKIDLPTGYRVPLRPPGLNDPTPPEVSELNINTTYTDKSYLRALMAAEMHSLSGIPTPEIFHVHQRENAAFYSVALCVEQVDDAFLERQQWDSHGALYKAVGDNGACDFTTAPAFEKKNRFPEGYADLQAVVTSLGLTGQALETWLFDNIDVANWVNWHAGTVISQNIDASNKNYYIYRDSLGSREWSVLPWDLDLSFGPNALNTDTIVFNQNSPSTPVCTSHPLIGARPWQLHTDKFNRMIEAMAKTPRVREMIARRIRSLSDQFLATSWFSSRMDQLVPVITRDVDADHARWGVNSHFAWSGTTAYSLAQSVQRIKSSYLAGRTNYLTGTGGTNHGNPFSLNFSNGSGSLGVPAPQEPIPALSFGAIVANPPSGNQDEEFIEIRNTSATAVDLSRWQLTGGVSFTFPGGTIVNAGNSLYVSPDRRAFRNRTTSPRGGERLFVTGPYKGHLGNFGETLTLLNDKGTAVTSTTLTPQPSDPQRFLAISEIHYNPPGPSDDTEFLEFLNTSTDTALDLTGVTLTEGLAGSDETGNATHFSFPDGWTLAPGARALAVRSRSAFKAAYPTVPDSLIAGEFPALTALANGGESLRLDDRSGSTIVSFTYGDRFPWPQLPDGNGHSLVHMNPTAGDAHHANPGNWRASAIPGGSPGSSDELPAPANPDADDNGNGISNLLESIMGPDARIWSDQENGSPLVSWHQQPGADHGRIVIESSQNLSSWSPAEFLSPVTESLSAGLILRRAPVTPPASGRLYFRARIIPPP